MARRSRPHRLSDRQIAKQYRHAMGYRKLPRTEHSPLSKQQKAAAIIVIVIIVLLIGAAYISGLHLV